MKDKCCKIKHFSHWIKFAVLAVNVTKMQIFMVLISKFEKPIYSRVHSSSIRALIFFTPGFRATVYNFVIKGPVPQLPKFLPINLSLLFCSSRCCSTYTYLRNELQSKHDMTFLQGRGLQKNC